MDDGGEGTMEHGRCLPADVKASAMAGGDDGGEGPWTIDYRPWTMEDGPWTMDHGP